MKMCEVLRYLNGSAIKLKDVFNWLKVVSGFEYTKTKIQEKAFTGMGYKSNGERCNFKLYHAGF